MAARWICEGLIVGLRIKGSLMRVMRWRVVQPWRCPVLVLVRLRVLVVLIVMVALLVALLVVLRLLVIGVLLVRVLLIVEWRMVVLVMIVPRMLLLLVLLLVLLVRIMQICMWMMHMWLVMMTMPIKSFAGRSRRVLWAAGRMLLSIWHVIIIFLVWSNYFLHNNDGMVDWRSGVKVVGTTVRRRSTRLAFPPLRC